MTRPPPPRCRSTRSRPGDLRGGRGVPGPSAHRDPDGFWHGNGDGHVPPVGSVVRCHGRKIEAETPRRRAGAAARTGRRPGPLVPIAANLPHAKRALAATGTRDPPRAQVRDNGLDRSDAHRYRRAGGDARTDQGRAFYSRCPPRSRAEGQYREHRDGVPKGGQNGAALHGASEAAGEERIHPRSRFREFGPRPRRT